ncbi:TPA: MFS transporter [Candidatus Nomurabacteria bacterium]|uniref:Major facilitator superfamily (MFS) profile domain-containing protein n=1 Tax=Candidatus Nomurabacteria bacterium GW2011_GWE1_35_16 TaxID=1618761 RepID=A0A0G0BQP3_9BACT|nr:MAG: hypothetical protein UR55_C0015G0005 [Candidatus Nomurabacteria bacterium GW2011_GWF1_34_20]KKP61743.1 MAG: hypothetical protein UR57_C0014G0005 [Candidatus Nomurabacteria bacterium GW2011_GWE2_34_25]KKP65966.1 MAG: hypothetical protein UR64_C0015G0005 [Candidatus Nomurabacteria bacterium GW2011_GWE1_35_16]HAE36813.1 MFS transporter [Candidatus Nomurabacteria bacterium]HAX65484.1 MFS transporter [Candidatus Nomurabacteria bacterium]
MDIKSDKNRKSFKNFFKQTFSSLGVRNFRLYMIGQAISLSGTWMQVLAQGWLVLSLTHSGFQLGLVSALQFLPILVLSPWGGMMADKFNKRKIIIFTQGMFAMLAIALGLMVVTGKIEIWMIYIFALMLGIVTSIDNPTRQSFISEMVGKDRITNAVTLSILVVNIARAIGPVIGGIVIVSAGIGMCFILNGISFLAVIVVLFLMRSGELHQSVSVKKNKMKILDGIRYVRTSKPLSNTLIMMAIIGTLTYEFAISMPLLAQSTYNGTAALYATFISAIGLGSILGGLLSAIFVKKATQKLLVFTALMFGLTFTLVGIIPSKFITTILLFIVGVFSVNFISWGNSTLQSESSNEMRSQVMALWSMAFLGSTFIGGPIIGLIGQYAGARASIIVGGIAAIIAAFIGFRSIKKSNIQKLNTEIIKI